MNTAEFNFADAFRVIYFENTHQGSAALDMEKHKIGKFESYIC